MNPNDLPSWDSNWQKSARGLSLPALLVYAGLFLVSVAASAGQVAETSGASQAISVTTSDQRGPLAHYLNERDAGLPGAVVRAFSIGWGPTERTAIGECRWLFIHASKAGGGQFRIWLLSRGYPPPTFPLATETINRFILQRGDSTPLEFRHRVTGRAVLPTLGGWDYLLPRATDPASSFAPGASFPARAAYLGHRYRLVADEPPSAAPDLPDATVIELLPDVLVGLPSNTRQENEKRRYDGSDYKLRRLTRSDFREMAAAGINCVRVDAEQRGWIDDLGLFYWGLAGQEVPYPDCLYDSRYLGPTLFLDEPAVHTRDSVIRPRLAKDQAFRKALTPQVVLEAFHDTFSHAWQEGAPTSLLQGFSTRADVDLGDMSFRQANLFSWETMVSTAAYQLSQDREVPAAMVFEPPGRIGTLRTLPEFDMTYGCQIPVDNPKNFISIIYGFLRGAARLTKKEWGTSIYGAVDRADAPWFLTHAYDLGATRFFFWDNAGLACVPFSECLGLARQIKMRAEDRPNRDLERLRQAAEVLILLPPGYNLGHVQMGRGSLWGLGELNLERANREGVKYRDVMGNFFVEIERCLRLGVGFDLLWDLPNAQPSGYREVVRIREDGRVESTEEGKHTLFERARVPARPAGVPPALEVALSSYEGTAPLYLTARAEVGQTTAPVYYTLGADNHGVYHNAVVAWELYGPGEEDYRIVTPPGLTPRVTATGGKFETEVEFAISRPGSYRPRAATVDSAGRSTIKWTAITVTP